MLGCKSHRHLVPVVEDMILIADIASTVSLLDDWMEVG